MQVTTIREQPRFEKEKQGVLTEKELQQLMTELFLNPLAGALIRNGGGLRKIRVATKGGGKSGGARAIYYFYTEEGVISLESVYPKSSKANLSAAELKELRKKIE